MNDNQRNTLTRGTEIAHIEGLHRLGNLLRVVREVGEEASATRVAALLEAGTKVASDLVNHSNRVDR